MPNLPYSALYAFGDSLSDAGNVSIATALIGQTPVSPPYFKETYGNSTANVFSNGPVAVQDLSLQLGLGILAPSLLGGNDFAYGGAETGSTPQNSGNLQTPLLSLPFQLTQFEIGVSHPVADALFTLSVGGNDIFDILSDTSLSAAQQARDVTAAVSNESADITRLAKDGAKNLVVFTVPDLGKVPEVTFGLANGSDKPNAGTDALASSLAASYNTQLVAAITQATAATGINITTVDLYGLTDAAVADPGAYGLNSVNVPAWTGTFADPKSGTLNSTSQAVQNQSLFWDDFHPTASVHNDAANIALAAIAPIRIYQADLPANTTSIHTATAAVGTDLDIHGDYAAITANDVALFSPSAGVFLHSGTGNDIMEVYSGNNVLSAGGGSNFLVGGTGNDTFLADATGGASSWNALLDFHAGDVFSVVGWTPGVSAATWTDGNGTALTGATLHIDLTGKGTVYANATFIGVSAQTAAGYITSTGTAGSNGYYAVKA
ncbi:MAG TPA: SGNH/GDSL hydrolase family protein [Acetobacteraceae bacterium]